MEKQLSLVTRLILKLQLIKKNLQITSVQADGQELDFKIDNDAEAVRITLPQTGKVTFTVTYNTKLTDSMMGIYPSYYEVDGEKKQNYWNSI